MTDATSGLKTALASALGAHGDVGDDAADLFGEPAAAGGEVVAAGPRGGRPKGARNKSTEAWRSYLIQRYGNPLEELLRLGMSSTAEIAEELHLRAIERDKEGVVICRDLDLSEAARVKRSALEACLPYLSQKLPVAIEAVGKERGVLILGDLTMAAMDEQGLALPLAPTEQNQQVIDAEVVTSDVQASDEQAK